MLDTHQPFSAVQKKSYLDMMEYFNNKIKIPKRSDVIDLLNSNYEHLQDEIVQLLSRVDTKLSFAVDCWTSKTKNKYIGINIFYIKDFKLKNFTVDFIPCEYEDGSSLKRSFVRCTEKYGILHRIIGLITDNGIIYLMIRWT